MEKTEKALTALLCALSLNLFACRGAGADPGVVAAYYYGEGDGYLGRHHAAYWWAKIPKEFGPVVGRVHFGIATADRDTPFGTVLQIEIVAIPGWGKEEYRHLIGREATGVVVDRMAPSVESAIDLWPALARKLMGPDWKRIGKVYVEIREDKHETDSFPREPDQQLGGGKQGGRPRFHPAYPIPR